MRGMTWLDKIMRKLADWRYAMFNYISSLGFDGWFYIFVIMFFTQLLSLILPMITTVIFASGILGFVNWVRWFFRFEDEVSLKRLICGFIGTALGVGMVYLMDLPHEIIWV